MSTSLPWSSESTFRVWNYRVSHSQLVLRNPRPADEFLEITFVGVEWMELGRFFQGITVTEVADAGQRPIPAVYRGRLLLTELRDSRGTTGFVASGGLHVRRMSAVGEELAMVLVKGAPSPGYPDGVEP